MGWHELLTYLVGGVLVASVAVANRELPKAVPPVRTATSPFPSPDPHVEPEAIEAEEPPGPVILHESPDELSRHDAAPAASIEPHRARGIAGVLDDRPAGTVYPALPSGREDRRTRAYALGWAARTSHGKSSATLMAGNGDRPVIVYVPIGLDPKQPVCVLTYFHGHKANVTEERLLAAFEALTQTSPQTLIVVPRAAEDPFNTWLRAPESFTALERQAVGEAARLSGVTELSVSIRIVSAHSGGGVALKNAAKQGDLRADKINLLDSAYGSWAEVVTRWALAQPVNQRPRLETWHTPHQALAHRRIKAMAEEAGVPELVTVHDENEEHGHSHRQIRYAHLGAK
jgi:hypothetical protein